MYKKDKKLVSLFHFNINIAGKDMFLVPKYLSDKLGFSGEIVYPKSKENIEFNNEYRDVKLTPIRSLSKYYSTIWSEKEMAWWLIKNAKRIDVLCLFWLNRRNVIFAKIYKILNKRGVCYVKGDLGYVDFSKLKTKGLMFSVKNYLYEAIDVYSVETSENYKAIQNGLFGKNLKKATVLMSNGFDIELFEQLKIRKREFSDKENILLTVGRLGTIQKNNEMMLAALDGLNMGDWKFLLIGNLEEHFLKVYDDFILKNPDKKDKVILTGVIYNRTELWEIYNKAKVFLLTSEWECMAQVLSEALAFGNYIISTKVAGYDEISDSEKLGKIIEIGDVKGLKNILSDIFESKVDLESNYIEALKLSDTKLNWRKLVEVISHKINEINNN